MKIEINYDLISKIVEANIGLDFKKSIKKGLICGTMAAACLTAIDIAASAPMNEIMGDIAFSYCYQAVWFGLTDTLLSKINKSLSIDKLKLLAQTLRSINVNTNYDLLLQSYAYDTTYEINLDGSFPKLEQKKYIMVPVYDNGEEKEVSLVQEHTIGSNSYSLSIGSPKKVLKLATNPA